MSESSSLRTSPFVVNPFKGTSTFFATDAEAKAYAIRMSAADHDDGDYGTWVAYAHGECFMYRAGRPYSELEAEEAAYLAEIDGQLPTGWDDGSASER
jgi:hypothetical protein